MAPPSPGPRLAGIIPERFARKTVQSVYEVASALVSRTLSPVYAVLPLAPGHESLDTTELFLTLRDLAAYAVQGAPLDGELEEDYLPDLLPLYGSVVGPRMEIDGLKDADPTTELGLVIAASMARDAITKGRSVTTSQLAVLSGLRRRQVQGLIGYEIPARLSADEHREGPHGGRWEVAATDAQAWLKSRGAWR